MSGKMSTKSIKNYQPDQTAIASYKKKLDRLTDITDEMANMKVFGGTTPITVYDFLAEVRLAPTGKDTHHYMIPTCLPYEGIDTVSKMRIRIKGLKLRYPFNPTYKKATFAISAEQDKLFRNVSDRLSSLHGIEPLTPGRLSLKSNAQDMAGVELGKRYDVVVKVNGVFTYNAAMYVSLELFQIKESKRKVVEEDSINYFDSD